MLLGENLGIILISLCGSQMISREPNSCSVDRCTTGAHPPSRFPADVGGFGGFSSWPDPLQEAAHADPLQRQATRGRAHSPCSPMYVRLEDLSLGVCTSQRDRSSSPRACIKEPRLSTPSSQLSVDSAWAWECSAHLAKQSHSYCDMRRSLYMPDAVSRDGWIPKEQSAWRSTSGSEAALQRGCSSGPARSMRPAVGHEQAERVVASDVEEPRNWIERILTCSVFSGQTSGRMSPQARFHPTATLTTTNSPQHRAITQSTASALCQTSSSPRDSVRTNGSDVSLTSAERQVRRTGSIMQLASYDTTHEFSSSTHTVQSVKQAALYSYCTDS